MNGENNTSTNSATYVFLFKNKSFGNNVLSNLRPPFMPQRDHQAAS